jgi:hypothetical protein
MTSRLLPYLLLMSVAVLGCTDDNDTLAPVLDAGLRDAGGSSARTALDSSVPLDAAVQTGGDAALSDADGAICENTDDRCTIDADCCRGSLGFCIGGFCSFGNP